MTAGLMWAIILGAVVTIGLVSLIPVWIAIRFPDRAAHDTVPAYMRRGGAAVLHMQREAPKYGGAPAQTAA